MKTTYRIRDWDTHFEVSQSKRSAKNSWVAIPNKHDGKSYRRLMRTDPQHYLAWMLIVQVASKMPERGLLADADGPLTPEDLSIKTDCPADVFAKALPVLCSTEIGWLEKAQGEADSEPTRSRLGADSESTLLQTDRTNKTDNGRPAADAACAEFQTAWNGLGQPFSTINKWTASRDKALRSRLKDDFFRAHWRAALGRMAGSDFHRGAGAKQWVATVDWFLKPDSVVKLMEQEPRRADADDAPLKPGEENFPEQDEAVVMKALGR